jgi:hypothetical protein
MAHSDVDLLRPFFIKIESYDNEVSDSVICYNIDVISQELVVTVPHRYSDFYEVICHFMVQFLDSLTFCMTVQQSPFGREWG